MLPPHHGLNDDRPATPGVERGKFGFEEGKLLADLGQVIPIQGAALDRVRLTRGCRLVRGLPAGDQIKEFFTCPDGAHSVLHIARKNVQVAECAECAECANRNFEKNEKKARRGPGC